MITCAYSPAALTNLVAHGLSKPYLVLQFLDFTTGSWVDWAEIERNPVDPASECVRRFVVRADRRTGVHADVERLVGGEAAGDGLLHAASTDFLVIYIEPHSAALSDAPLRQKHDTNGRVAFWQWLR